MSLIILVYSSLEA